MQIPRLRRWRERQGLTQKELADLAGVSPRSVAGYEGGDGTRPNTARKLADALGVAVADLMEEDIRPKASLQQRVDALRRFSGSDQETVFRFRTLLVERELRRVEARLQEILNTEEGEAAFAMLRDNREDISEDARRAARDYEAAMERVRELLRRTNEEARELPIPEDENALREHYEKLLLA